MVSPHDEHIFVPMMWLTQYTQSKGDKFSTEHPWQYVTLTCFSVVSVYFMAGCLIHFSFLWFDPISPSFALLAEDKGGCCLSLLVGITVWRMPCGSLRWWWGIVGSWFKVLMIGKAAIQGWSCIVFLDTVWKSLEIWLVLIKTLSTRSPAVWSRIVQLQLQQDRQIWFYECQIIVYQCVTDKWFDSWK